MSSEQIDDRRVALITGCCGGIGQALVEVFADAGYRVIGVDQDASAPARVDEYLRMDLRQFADDAQYRDAECAKIRAVLPTGNLHALINNAAVQITDRFERLTVDQWQQTLDVNLLAPALLIRSLLDELKSAHGTVVNVSSIHARLTKPGFAAYATSKAALAGLTRALAVECAPAIRVNAVEPAAVDTPMLRKGFADQPDLPGVLADFHPVGRIGRPQEIAAACLYLCSDSAQFINGSVISLDGGAGSRLHDPV